MEKLDLQVLDVIGNFVEASGATTAAVGYTKQAFRERETNQELAVIGNTLQGLGNTMQAVAETDDEYAKKGSWIQASGAFSSAIGEGTILYLRNQTEGTKIGILGNTLQATGGTITALGRTDNEKRYIGNLIQVIGNILEAIGGLFELGDEKEKGLKLFIIGAWLQSIGSSLQTIGSLEDYAEAESETREGQLTYGKN